MNMQFRLYVACWSKLVSGGKRYLALSFFSPLSLRAVPVKYVHLCLQSWQCCDSKSTQKACQQQQALNSGDTDHRQVFASRFSTLPKHKYSHTTHTRSCHIYL
jgi:hypothetical protein